MRNIRLWHFGVCVALVTACGGRTGEVDSDGDGGNPSKAGGRSATGGAPNAAGRASSGGSVSRGGSSMGCACPDIGCGPGFRLVPDPNNCCGTCEPIPCPTVPCPGIACASGQHLEVPEGECCPVCVPDIFEACAAGQQAYRQLREQLLEKYSSLGCKSDWDCGVIWESNRCVATCGDPLPEAVIADAKQNLSSFAEMSCASCALIPFPPCPPRREPTCQLNRCN